MKMRKFISVLLLVSLLLFAFGCNSEPPQTDDSQNTTPTLYETADEVTQATTAFSEAVTNAPAPPVEIPYEPYVPEDYEMRDISAWELVGEVQVGWNLGNTFDAPGGETSWGNPETTFTMISRIAEAGFDSVRMPVTWSRHLGEAPDYLIDGEWLDRVEEVVGYIMSTGMYCIINTHHESWISPEESQEEAITEQLTAVWRQIGERFEDYNEKLIFEAMNEPRLVGTPDEWNGGTIESRGVINRLNAAFIDTVRALGGRNALRVLMIPTYAASAEEVAVQAVADAFSEVTGDDGKVIVSIHAYTPINFTLSPVGPGRWLPERQEEEINWMFARLKSTLIDNDIPVIMGETGAANKNNLNERVQWAKYYFGKAREYGIPAYWWDNGIFEARSETSELFGFFNRHSAEFAFPEILEAIIYRRMA